MVRIHFPRIRIKLVFFMQIRIQVTQICEKLPYEEFLEVENAEQLLNGRYLTQSWSKFTKFSDSDTPIECGSRSESRRKNECGTMRIRIHRLAQNLQLISDSK